MARLGRGRPNRWQFWKEKTVGVAPVSSTLDATAGASADLSGSFDSTSSVLVASAGASVSLSGSFDSTSSVLAASAGTSAAITPLVTVTKALAATGTATAAVTPAVTVTKALTATAAATPAVTPSVTVTKALTATASATAAISGLVSKYGRHYAVASCTSLANMQDWASRGGTHVLLQVFWDRWQNAVNGAVLSAGLSEYRGWIANARTAGLRIIIEFTMQYPPTFVQTNVAPFKMQSGTTYTDTATRDYIWTALGRTYIADFLAKSFTALNAGTDWDLVDTVRIGGLDMGELNYPPSHHASGSGSPVWWSHGTAAQTGTGLASDQVVSPFPGHFAFESTPTGTLANAQDTALLNWHVGGITNYMTWLINQHRSNGWSGTIHVLHPSFGVRYERTTTDLNYRYEAAQGCSWGVQMDAYPDSSVHPWCTWLDAVAAADPTSDMGNKSPGQYLKILADARGLDMLGGENAAGSTDTALTRIFTSATDGAIGGLGYAIYMHVNYPDLVAGTAGTLANITTQMAARPAFGTLPTGPPTVTSAITATASATAAVTGPVTVTKAVTATASASASVTGLLSISATLTTTASATAATSGSFLTKSSTVVATAAAAVSITPLVTETKALSASGVASATVSGFLTKNFALSASVTTSTTLGAVLQQPGSLSASATATAVALGIAVKLATLAATAQASATVDPSIAPVVFCAVTITLAPSGYTVDLDLSGFTATLAPSNYGAVLAPSGSTAEITKC